VIVFIVVPNNKSLANYAGISLQYLGNPPKSRIVVSRGEDIPFIVEDMSKNGKTAIGLTGRDLLKEFELSNYSSNLVILKTLIWDDPKAMFGKPTLCLSGPKGKKLDELPKNLKVCMNSKYKNLARKYLNTLESNGFIFTKTYLSGSTEAYCSNGMSDLVIEIVYSGASIKDANLEVYDKIFGSDFVIIGGKSD
jgi:ATP phosphoribosyltransferase